MQLRKTVIRWRGGKTSAVISEEQALLSINLEFTNTNAESAFWDFLTWMSERALGQMHAQIS